MSTETKTIPPPRPISVRLRLYLKNPAPKSSSYVRATVPMCCAPRTWTNLIDHLEALVAQQGQEVTVKLHNSRWADEFDTYVGRHMDEVGRFYPLSSALRRHDYGSEEHPVTGEIYFRPGLTASPFCGPRAARPPTCGRRRFCARP